MCVTSVEDYECEIVQECCLGNQQPKRAAKDTFVDTFVAYPTNLIRNSNHIELINTECCINFILFVGSQVV